MDSFADLLNQTNQSMADAGKKLKEGLKEGSLKDGLTGFNQGLEEMEVAMEPKRAAFWASLSDLPSWIPQAITKTWHDFVGALKKALGLLKPEGDDPPPTGDDPTDPPPPADEPTDPPPPAPPADEDPPPPADPAPPAEDVNPPAGKPTPPSDGAVEEAEEDASSEIAEEATEEAVDGAEEATEEAVDGAGGAADEASGEQGEANTEAPSAPHASDEDPWKSAKKDFLAANETTRFETFGRIGTLLMAEQAKQRRGQKSGALDPRTLRVLTDKLDPVRVLLAWMGGHLSERLATGKGYAALQSQLQIIGPHASAQVFGEVIRAAQRRAQRPGLDGTPRNAFSADRLGQLQEWMSGKK
jgi:outer membrane biosynthesis protein TonB